MVAELIEVLGNRQRLDGGAMFGNVPKVLWEQWLNADKDNRVELVTRGLIVKEANRTVLFETGIGAYMPPKLKQRFGVIEEEHKLLASLAAVGLTHEQIDVVVLSHLHFDHAGGMLSAYQDNKDYELLFPNAEIIISESAYQRALNPHPRDRASFIPDLMGFFEEQKHRIHLVKDKTSPFLGPNYRFHYSDGHTPGLLMTEIIQPERRVIFVSDLIPGAAWVHLPVTMGYDRAPELLIDEKKQLLDYCMSHNTELFFTHDPHQAYGRVIQDERGRYSTAI